MNRHERHEAILAVVRDQAVSTQTELAEALHRRGHDVVQTTVSRDISERKRADAEKEKINEADD